jgi:transcriptional regulator with XRE-family HTH domain
MEPTQPGDLQRLATAARNRRRKLGLTTIAVAVAAGISKDPYAKIEAGAPVRAATYAKVEPALGWAAGSIRAVLDGGDPTLAPTPTDTNHIPAADLSAAVMAALVTATDLLTSAQVRETARLTVAELARRGFAEEPTEGGSA